MGFRVVGFSVLGLAAISRYIGILVRFKVPKIRDTFSGGPHDNDYSVWGFTLGVSYLRKPSNSPKALTLWFLLGAFMRSLMPTLFSSALEDPKPYILNHKLLST